MENKSLILLYLTVLTRPLKRGGLYVLRRMTVTKKIKSSKKITSKSI